MKIGEYEQMMAYITRPGFKDGTEKIVEPPKSMQMDTTTSNPIPDYDINDFRNDAEIFILAYHNNTLPRADIADKLNAFAKKGVDAGTFTEQDAGDMVQRLIGEVKDRAQKQRLRDVVPEGIGTVDRDNLAPGGRPRLDVPGLEEEVKKLFNQGLSTNQVLKNLKEKPEFEKVSEGVVKRIKKEFNLGVKQADVLTSQADKYNKLKKLIEQSNNQLKFVDLRTLRERVGLPRKAAPTDKANMEKFNVPKLDSAEDKVKKGFFKIINNPNVPVEEVFDISSKIGRDTNLSQASVTQFLQDIPEYQDFKPTALKLQSPSFKGSIVNKNKTLADVMDMAENTTRLSSGYTSVANTPERFILNSVTRHIAQGGDKVEWVVPPSEGRDVDAVFRYKGKDYDYFDLLQDGRKIDDFKEVYDMYEKRDELLGREVTDPITKQKITFKELMQKAYNQGAGYSLTSNPYDIDHFGSVKNEPFSNLRILPQRINKIAGLITKTAKDAEKGFVTKQANKWTPTKSKIYLQKSGYNFTKDINQIFKDEVKLANDILVKGRKLRSPVDIGVEAANKKFKGFLDIEGVGFANEMKRSQSALEREAFERFNKKFKSQRGFIDARLLGADKIAAGVDKVADIAKLYGPEAARIASNAIKVPLFSSAFELPFISEYQDLGYSPKEIATQLLTGGMGVPFKDIQEKGKFVDEKGLGEALQIALRKQMIPQSIRPAMNLPADFGAPQELTSSEKQAMEIFGGEAQDVIDARRKIQADEYKRLEEMTDFNDPMFRDAAMNGGIMRLGFADGPEDPSKRKTMKILGGLASIPILGKFIKPAAKVAPAVMEAAKGMPAWFNTLVDKVIKTGTDATKRFATKDREEVYEKFMGEQEGVRVYKDLETGDTRVQYFSPDNMGGTSGSVDLVYKAPEKLEDGTTVPAQFKAVELEPRGVAQGPDDYDIEFDGENVVDSVEDLMSDTSRLEEFATGKTVDPNKAKTAKEKRDTVAKINEDQYEQAQYLETKYGPGPDPSDYTDYDDFE